MDNTELKKLLGTKQLLAINADTIKEKHFWGAHYLVLAEVMAFSDNFKFVELRNDSLKRVWMLTQFFQKAIVDQVTDEVPPHEQIAALEARVKELNYAIERMLNEESDKIRELKNRISSDRFVLGSIARWFEKNSPQARFVFPEFGGALILDRLETDWGIAPSKNEQEKVS